MNWYLEVLRKYAVFDGRARRKEYWYFALFSIIISIVLTIIGAIVLFVFVVQDSKPGENQYGSNPKSAVA